MEAAGIWGLQIFFLIKLFYFHLQYSFVVHYFGYTLNLHPIAFWAKLLAGCLASVVCVKRERRRVVLRGDVCPRLDRKGEGFPLCPRD